MRWYIVNQGKIKKNINNGGFIKKEEDVIPNKKLLKLEVDSLRKKKTRNQISIIKLKLIEL